MANYPQGIVFSIESGVILELVGETPINSFGNKDIGFGYIRQLGAIAFCGVVDQYVQYRIPDSLPFIQSGVTFCYVDASNVLFTQATISAP